jgi:hypothetical protein
VDYLEPSFLYDESNFHDSFIRYLSFEVGNLLAHRLDVDQSAVNLFWNSNGRLIKILMGTLHYFWIELKLEFHIIICTCGINKIHASQISLLTNSETLYCLYLEALHLFNEYINVLWVRGSYIMYLYTIYITERVGLLLMGLHLCMSIITCVWSKAPWLLILFCNYMLQFLQSWHALVYLWI